MNRQNALFLTLLAGLVIALALLVLPDDTSAAPGQSQDVDVLQAIAINEIRVDQTDTDDDEYFELEGPAGTPLHLLTYLVIGDGAGGSGVIEEVTSLTGQAIPTSGYFVAAESTFTLGTADMVTDLNFENGDNVTHLLVAGFSGADGQDLDTNDDGVLDVQPWTDIVDMVALIKEDNPPTTTEYYYGLVAVGPDGTFAPGHVYRCIWGWEIGPFDPTAGDDTPGAANACASLDLGVTKEGPLCAVPGEVAVYTIEVSNLAASDAGSVVLTDTLPVSTTYVADDSGWSCPACTPGAGGTLTWNVGTLPSGLVHTFNLTVTVDPAVASTVLTNQVAIASDLAGDEPGNNVAAVETSVATARIHDLQGATHFSPYEGQLLCAVPGIVTALTAQGFYMQDPLPDADEATSEGILVFTGGAPSVAVGDWVHVSGEVDEFFPGGADSGNLPTTELANPTIEVISSTNPLPAPTIIGLGGRVPPTRTIENDVAGDVLTGGVFDPAEDGLDFYESLEGMLVQVNDAVAVGPTNSFGEIPVVSNDEAYGGIYNPREGIVIQPGDFNPERIIVDDTLYNGEPMVETGAEFTAPITGVIDYSFGNYKLLNPEPLPTVEPSTIFSETTSLSNGLTIATFNVENLDPADTTFDELAVQIVYHLLSPDIIALQEIQDNSGPTDDGEVSASETYSLLIQAIQNVAGPVYDYRDIPPVNNTSGGEPGGNIRVGYLFQPDRVTFVDRGDAGPLDATQVVTTPTGGVHLSLSPGYVEPADPAFEDSRKPLAAEFRFFGQTLFLVNNHFASKGGDDPLFGRIQPPELSSEVQREAQAQVVNDLVDQILAADPRADVVVLGDLNDFQFSDPISDVLAADVLTDLIYLLPPEERYTYIFDGNSQALDHILVSAHLWQMMPDYDIVHVNAEWPAAERPTDHDPSLARFPFVESDLALSYKTVEPTGAVQPGDVLTYTVVLSNAGPADVTVTITDVLPAELILVSGFEGGGLTWTGMVSAGAQVTLTLVAQVDPDLPGRVTIANQVIVDDGVNPPFTITSPETTAGGPVRYYLPLIYRNYGATPPPGG